MVFLGHFIKRDNIWCSPRAPMTSKNVEGGKRECLNDPKCFMFYKFGEGKRFYSCSSTASIKVSSQGSTLYQTNGNQNISVIYIILKTYLITWILLFLAYVTFLTPGFLSECSDRLPEDYSCFDLNGIPSWNCSDWAGKGSVNDLENYCNEDWSSYRQCVPISTGLVKDFCKISCDNCGALYNIKIFNML